MLFAIFLICGVGLHARNDQLFLASNDPPNVEQHSMVQIYFLGRYYCIVMTTVNVLVFGNFDVKRHNGAPLLVLCFNT